MKVGATGVAVLVGLILAGCTPAPAPSETTSPTPSETATQTPTPTPTAETWVPSGDPADPAAFEHSDGGIVFASPSRNILCFYSHYADVPRDWGCSLIEQSVVLPPDPSGECTGSYSDGASKAPNGIWLKAGDPSATPTTWCGGHYDDGSAPTLAYGMSLTYREMGCDSTEDGMICRSLESGHGFRLSRSDYELF